MNIFTNIKEYITDRRIKRLRGDLLMIQKSEFEYNPFKIGMPTNLINVDSDNLTLIENLVWASAKGSAIKEFYKTASGKFDDKWDNRSTYFAATCPSDMRYVHTGLPKLVSESMSALVFGNGYKIEGVAYKDENHTDVDEEKSKNVTDALQKLFKSIKLNEKLIQSAMIESVTGDVAFKLSIDWTASYMPILEVLDRRNYVVNLNRGEVGSIDYKTFFEKEDANKNKLFYTLVETYTHNNQQQAIVLNELYETKDGRTKKVSLQSIPETAELEEKVNTGFVGTMAFHKKNKEYSGIFKNYPYGASDYSSLDLADGLDEIASQLVNEIRDNKTLRFFDERYFVKGVDGNFKKLDSYITNYVKYKGSNDQNAKPVSEVQFEDKTEQHIRKYKATVELFCASCKISPITLGLSGDIGLASSDATLRERAAISKETASKKKAIWTSYLNECLPELLRLAKYMTTLNNYPIHSKALAWKKLLNDIDLDNIDVVVTITPFDSKSLEDKLTMWSTAKQNGMASIETIISDLYSETWTQDEIDQEVNRIKIENNINLDNPELLQFDEEDEE